jgi:DNA transposition AAA+ family ATPase
MSTAAAFQVSIDSKTLVWDDELRDRFNSFRDRTSWDYGQIGRDMQRFYGRAKEKGAARNTGMGESTLRAYSTFQWASSQEALSRLEGRVRGWLDHREARGAVADIDQNVQAAKLIQFGLTQAHASRKFVVIVGRSGMGKTLLCRHFANMNTRGGMVIVECYDGMTPHAFLATVCRALGESDSGSKDALITRVAGTLSERPKLLAVDEANFLTEQSVNHLVRIWNQAHIGIALLGTDELNKIMKSSRFERSHSRLKVFIQLPDLSVEEIRTRLEEAFDKKEVTARVVELARQGCYGRYRDLDTLIDSAADALDKNPTKGLEAAFERISSRFISGRRPQR